MQKKRLNQQKQIKNTQGKFNNAGNSVPDDNQNQNHNTKKESLGPNTKR